jgi:flagellar hook-basal body complex protein FliE
MNVTLKPFDFNAALARAGLGADGMPIGGGIGKLGGTSGTGAATGVSKSDFSSAMSNALKAVSDQQNDADRLQRELQMDNPTVSLEQTMVSMQKAQIGFQAALTVRNRLVQSYTDIMNMQV